MAHENMKIKRAIDSRKPVYSARALEHEYLENVSRIDRLSTFRGPRSAVHRSSRVAASLEVAKSMRATRHRPGTDGYQRELSRTMTRNRSQSAHSRYGYPHEQCHKSAVCKHHKNSSSVSNGVQGCVSLSVLSCSIKSLTVS